MARMSQGPLQDAAVAPVPPRDAAPREATVYAAAPDPGAPAQTGAPPISHARSASSTVAAPAAKAPRNGPVALETPLQFLPGVGPKRAEHLAALGVTTAGDLLSYYPRDYLAYQAEAPIASLVAGSLVAIRGNILQTRMMPGRQRRFEALLEDASGRCVLTWFNPFGITEKVRPGVQLRAIGKVGQYGGRFQMVQPKIDLLQDQSAVPAAARIEAVYGASSGISSPIIGRIVRTNLPALLPLVEEWFAADYLAQRNLTPRREAVRIAHEPVAMEQVQRARRTLAYHEFFLHQAGIAIKRHHQKESHAAMALGSGATVDQRIRALLEFPLTAAQNRVIKQLTHDLGQRRPMNRLLQGDVGSGKTVVALYAMLVAVANKTQAVLMAPTEVLAEQHFITLERYLRNSKVKLDLLTGNQPAEKRRTILAGLETGAIGLVVATHAVLNEQVKFQRLTVVVVDEQHKFGVEQRAAIRARHGAPHTLVMTATPIPRTLAMTVFGDLDVSLIDALPPGRQKIFTRATGTDNRQHVYEFVATRVRAGEQAYVVLPVIDEGASDLTSATGMHQELSTGYLKHLRVGLLHGRMDSPDRQHVMERFRQKLIDVLVATTVIEVGVDVPNATVMVVEHADRFGLSQLHQLRGRVGRGDKPSQCILISDASTEQGAQRLQAMVKFTSGFKIAEEDLRIRGMGEIIGTKQSGHSDFHFADLLLDTALLQLARRDAFHAIAADPRLLTPEHAHLRRAVLARFGSAISLADVG